MRSQPKSNVLDKNLYTQKQERHSSYRQYVEPCYMQSNPLPQHWDLCFLWVHQYAITPEPLEIRVFLSSLRHFPLATANVNMPPVSSPVYSCRKNAESQHFMGDLLANKEACRNRQASFAPTNVGIDV